LLGFDVCEGFEHSVLSMVVKKKLPREGKGSGWFADLQVDMHMPTCLASLLHCKCCMFSSGDDCCWVPAALLMCKFNTGNYLAREHTADIHV